MFHVVSIRPNLRGVVDETRTTTDKGQWVIWNGLEITRFTAAGKSAAGRYDADDDVGGLQASRARSRADIGVEVVGVRRVVEDEITSRSVGC